MAPPNSDPLVGTTLGSFKIIRVIGRGGMGTVYLGEHKFIGSRVAIIDGDERLTFADVEREMRNVAKALIASGVDKGDRVAVWAPNSWRWIVAALGTLATGAWLVPVNTRFKGHEAAFSLGQTDAKVLFTVDGFVGNDQGIVAARNMLSVEDNVRHHVPFFWTSQWGMSLRYVGHAESWDEIVLRPNSIATCGSEPFM